MADIKCKVCGGSINMGKCELCGTTYSIDEIRQLVQSQTAGDTSTNPTPTTSVVQSNTNNNISRSNDDLSRDTLILHLNDVRVLETILKNDKQKLEDLEKQHEIKYNEFQKAIDITFREPPQKVNNNDLYYYGKFTAVIGIVAVMIAIYIAFALLLRIIGLGLPLLKPMLVFIILMIIYCSITSRKDKKDDAEYQKILQVYNKEKNKFEEDKRKIVTKAENMYNDYKQSYDNIVSELNDEMNEAKYLLKQAYGLNIIPSQFRDINGVYYLYDYLSTSNQSLSEALMQYNLEAIKSKLDNMIKLQSMAIIEQAQTNAKMDIMINQNRQILDNSKESKYYTKVSAINSEINKKLSAESLAYQKADLWLKQSVISSFQSIL